MSSHCRGQLCACLHCKVRIASVLQLEHTSFLLVLNGSTMQLAVKWGLVVSQLQPLSPALTPSDHQL